ncbi:LysR family substrate-binding domain-containing protein [Porticoccus sp.]|uniref:LysR family substrate-binding domain-containing protein n=1 Tax=Porticoccus sp. TaxID=2024853 RepID=UPI000C5CACF8|nr:LysR family substrate-binding domain-containing protein [Porticoccus sp.]MAZ69275.1 hypothetical protein [Porticoccus sp.]|tara:strand:- start:315 stop:983 length:669 start_codon:yes stop_codon:yes gene_type:complete
MDTENSSSLHIVLCDTLTHPQLATLLARQRAEEPNVKIQVHESSTSSISQKFSRGQYDIGISRSAIVNDRWKAVPLWREAWIVAASIHSSLGRESIVTPAHLMDFTIIHWDAVFRKASFLELDTILRSLGNQQPNALQTALTVDVMMALVSANYGVTIAPAPIVARYQSWGIVGRPLANPSPTTTTYLIHRSNLDPGGRDGRFIERALSIPWVTHGRLGFDS